MATFTGSAAAPGVQPRVVKTGGLFPITCEFTVGASLADADVILLAKVANQVTVHMFAVALRGGADAQNLMTLRVGTTAISTTLTGSLTATFLHGWPQANGLPYKLSLTDNADPQFSYLNVLMATGNTATATIVFKVTLFCSVDP